MHSGVYLSPYSRLLIKPSAGGASMHMMRNVGDNNDLKKDSLPGFHLLYIVHCDPRPCTVCPPLNQNPASCELLSQDQTNSVMMSNFTNFQQKSGQILARHWSSKGLCWSSAQSNQPTVWRFNRIIGTKDLPWLISPDCIRFHWVRVSISAAGLACKSPKSCKSYWVKAAVKNEYWCEEQAKVMICLWSKPKH